MNLFSYRLKEMRLKREMTQTELGNKVNVTKVSISGYERGTRFPDLETLTLLSKALNVSINYLLGLEINALSEEGTDYVVLLSSIDLKIIETLKKYPKLYNQLVENTENTIELLSSKIAK